MSFNPFTEKPIALEKTIVDWSKLYPSSYDKYEVDAYTKVRCILMNGTEFESNWYLHQFSRHCNDNDIRRVLCMIRRSEQQQQKRIACLKPINETVLETTISYEQLAVDLTAILAQREKNKYVKEALDFGLLEDFDHLYRYANLLDMEDGVHAERLVGSYTEIMPARPTIAEHRYPIDDIKRSVDFKTADPITKLNIATIIAAEQQTMNYYMNQAGFYTSDLGRQLYQEIAMIEEQHVSHYGALTDVNTTWLECLLNHQYTECYLYYSCYKDETDIKVKQIWEEMLVQEISHLHIAADMLKKYENKDWQQVIPVGEFPELISFAPQKNYVRQIIQSTAENTAHLETYVDINELDHKAKYFDYQNIVNHDINNVASHKVIEKHIRDFGTDYRYEDSPNPRVELRNRKEDNSQFARVRVKNLVNS
jgi:rubrerythrin